MIANKPRVRVLPPTPATKSTYSWESDPL
jgi:hypothetical protein